MSVVGPREKCKDCPLWHNIECWIGTPFHYRGHTPGVAVDCVSLSLLLMEGIGALPKGEWRKIYSTERLRAWKRGVYDVERVRQVFEPYATFVERPDKCGDIQLLFNPRFRRLHFRISLPDKMVLEALPDLGVVIGGEQEFPKRYYIATLRFFSWGCER